MFGIIVRRGAGGGGKILMNESGNGVMLVTQDGIFIAVKHSLVVLLLRICDGRMCNGGRGDVRRGRDAHIAFTGKPPPPTLEFSVCQLVRQKPARHHCSDRIPPKFRMNKDFVMSEDPLRIVIKIIILHVQVTLLN